jgi:cobalt/nickel transport system permease protein
MHISDGILTPEWCIVWFIVAAVFAAIGVVQISKKRRIDPAYMSAVGLMGAAVFVISVWHIPVPVTGSCSHPVGTPMAAMILGPFPTVLVSAIALFFQTFIGHGGITTIGANTISMGIVGTFTGFFTIIGLKKVFDSGVFGKKALNNSIWLAAGFGGLVGDLMTYVAAAFQLALSLHPENFFQWWGIFTLTYLPTQVPLAILEFGFTAAAIQYIATHRPGLLKWTLGIKVQKSNQAVIIKEGGQ